MGADHTAGLIVNPGLPEQEWAQASQEIQLVNAATDSSGFCQFLQPTLDDIRKFYSLLYGEDVTREQVADIGWQCMQDEWEFNRRAGWKREDDVMPDCMKQDAVGPANAVWDVKDEVVQSTYRRFEGGEAMFTTKAAG
jgi:aldehyde:ferredoxin oxidoreductase